MQEHCQLFGIISPEAQLPENMIGYQGQKLEILYGDGLAALVSKGQIDIGQQPERILEFYQAQLAALEQIQAISVLPARLGSGVSSQEVIQLMLVRHRDLLLEQLKSVAGMAQFNLTAFWDLNQEIAKAASHQDVQSFRVELQTRGNVTLEDQARVGELISMHLEHERQRLTDKVLLSLEPLLKEYGLVAREQEEIAFNMPLLMLRYQKPQLEQRLAEVQKDLSNRLQFQLSAAQPATAFRLLEVIEPKTIDLEKARLTLRLPANTPSAPAQIHRAYKQLALEKHPDRRPNHPFAADEMQELSWARDLLELAGSGIGVRVQKMVNT